MGGRRKEGAGCEEEAGREEEAEREERGGDCEEVERKEQGDCEEAERENEPPVTKRKALAPKKAPCCDRPRRSRRL